MTENLQSIMVGEQSKLKCFVPQCRNEFKSGAGLKLHVQTIHFGIVPKFVCSINGCAEVYKTKTGINLHVRKIHLGTFKKFLCSFCNSTFSSKYARNGHIMARHTLERPFTCEECPSKFSSNDRLKQHQLVHTNAKPYKCKICSKPFKRGHSLKLHTLSAHSKRIRDVQCPTCQEPFITQSDMKLHAKMHRPTGSGYPCYFCKREITRLSTLERHIRTHTQEKPFSCSVGQCKFSSSYSSSVIMHRKIQHPPSGEKFRYKIWSCYFCFKAITGKFGIANHLRIHTLEEPFVCGLCQKSFKRECNLRNHIASHTKEKPYKCEECQKSFSTSGDLQRHIANVHRQEKRYFCQDCSFSAYEKYQLANHSLKHQSMS